MVEVHSYFPQVLWHAWDLHHSVGDSRVQKKPPVSIPPSACNTNGLKTRKGKRLESAFQHIATQETGTVQLSPAFAVV